MENLRHSPRSSFCEWKGQATYYDIVVGDKVAPAAAWSYPQPSPTFASIKDNIAFYPQYMDACWVDGERVTPQPGESLISLWSCRPSAAPELPLNAHTNHPCTRDAAQASSMAGG